MAQAENARRAADYARLRLCPILVDPSFADPASVPAADAKTYVRSNSNLATGGESADLTDEAHPSVLEVARRALASFPGLP